MPTAEDTDLVSGLAPAGDMDMMSENGGLWFRPASQRMENALAQVRAFSLWRQVPHPA